jgi:hypothetical protein
MLDIEASVEPTAAAKRISRTQKAKFHWTPSRALRLTLCTKICPPPKRQGCLHRKDKAVRPCLHEAAETFFNMRRSAVST